MGLTKSRRIKCLHFRAQVVLFSLALDVGSRDPTSSVGYRSSSGRGEADKVGEAALEKVARDEVVRLLMAR